jgi:hypothetical protein
VAIHHAPACKLTMGNGGGAGERRTERNKVPGGRAALGTASMESMPPVYAGSGRRCGGWEGCGKQGAEPGLKSESGAWCRS